MDYVDSITYPTESDDWLRTVLIGGALLLFSFLLIPMFLAYGHVVAVVKSTLAGETEPPAFDDWGTLLTDGLQAWVIGLIYMIVPLAVAGATVGGAVLAFATGSETGAALGIAGLLGGLAVSFALALAFGYVAVVAVVNFASEGRFGAAFDFGTIAAVATDVEYAIPWAVSVVVFAVAGAVGGMLGAIPVLGGILAVFLFFFALIVAANLWGLGFDAARGPAIDGSVDPEGAVAEDVRVRPR